MAEVNSSRRESFVAASIVSQIAEQVHSGARELAKHRKLTGRDIERLANEAAQHRKDCPGCEQCAGGGVVLALPNALALHLVAAHATAMRAVDDAKEGDAVGALVAVATAQAVLLTAAGLAMSLDLGDARNLARSRALLGAAVRHAPTRHAKALVLQWWKAHGVGKMTKEQASDAITSGRLVSEARTTVRRWLRGV
jgi:hypothetical protein